MSGSRVLPSRVDIRREESPGLTAFLDRQIYAHNSRVTGIDDGAALIGEVLDDAGALVGAISGHTWGGTCEIVTLWVHESLRRQGLGKALVRAAEDSAIERGCTQIVVATHSFQAPAFYERLGFVKVADIVDYPKGHAKFILVKKLDPSSDGQ